MELAFTAAAGRPASTTELGAGNIGGMTLTAGVYKWGTGLLIPTNVTLSGTANDVFIFQIAQDLTMSSGAHIVLSGGALPKNIFWQVAGRVDLNTTAHGEGVYLSQTAIPSLRLVPQAGQLLVVAGRGAVEGGREGGAAADDEGHEERREKTHGDAEGNRLPPAARALKRGAKGCASAPDRAMVLPHGHEQEEEGEQGRQAGEEAGEARRR